MSIELREYQKATVDRARAARRAGHRRILISAPTGSGKTVMAVQMIVTGLTLGARFLVIAHRKELIDQFYSQLRRVGITPGIMRGSDDRTDAEASVQLGTVQTLTRRQLPPADIVFVDEAHRVPGDSYARVLQAYPKATVLGFTATPCRLDGRPLKEHFDVLIESAPYSVLLDGANILAPIVYAPMRPPDLSKVRKVAGDYDEGQLSAVMGRAHVIGDVVRTWQHRAEGRKTVVFAVSVEHSRGLRNRFEAEGVRVAHLDGTTPEAERTRVLVDLELGRLDVVCNVGVLCEGWDQPAVKCCVMARPTLSLTLWMQCAGRILRPWCPACGGKCVDSSHPPYVPPILLDHSGNADRHGLPHEDRQWSLEGRATRQVQTIYRVCAGCYAYVDRMPCPLCGYQAEVKKREIREAPGVLKRIDENIAKEKAQAVERFSADPRRAYFEAQAEIARKRGFKPGYASAKFKEKFNDEWPPWAWSKALITECAKDGDWQARIEKKAREREFWQEREAKRAPAEEVAYEPEPDESGIDSL